MSGNNQQGWCITEIYSSGGEGYDGATTICFSESREKLLKYIETEYLFNDSPEILDFFNNDEEDVDGHPQYIDLTKKEALKMLEKDQSVTVIIQKGLCQAQMMIESCSFV
jgi:hypothetical protein